MLQCGVHFLPAAIGPVRVLQADRPRGIYTKTGFFPTRTVRNPAAEKNPTVVAAREQTTWFFSD
jgi:hypothetical protein